MLKGQKKHIDKDHGKNVNRKVQEEPLAEATANPRYQEEQKNFVCVEGLRPSQQLRSCRAGQLPINTVPGPTKTY